MGNRVILASFFFTVKRHMGIINARHFRIRNMPFDLPHLVRSVDVFQPRESRWGRNARMEEFNSVCKCVPLSRHLARTGNPRRGDRLGNLKSHHLRTCQSVDIIRFE